MVSSGTHRCTRAAVYPVALRPEGAVSLSVVRSPFAPFVFLSAFRAGLCTGPHGMCTLRGGVSGLSRLARTSPRPASHVLGTSFTQRRLSIPPFRMLIRAAVPGHYGASDAVYAAGSGWPYLGPRYAGGPNCRRAESLYSLGLSAAHWPWGLPVRASARWRRSLCPLFPGYFCGCSGTSLPLH